MKTMDIKSYIHSNMRDNITLMSGHQSDDYHFDNFVFSRPANS
jgi:hypothetical protein